MFPKPAPPYLPLRSPAPGFFRRGRRPARIPVQARSRSDNYAAVLGLQKTQPKDRRIYTAFTGILAGRRPLRKKPGAGERRGR
ncbi:hypothetical protein BEI59_10375 [Eisenbergiella tayi]|uniref:Uncharacterized protein n=1 Tax=Eisenbergiella tayi TaxID=1432052 RepID=A0A1E3UJB2_9FIRM|nr:hypothetical protein BEI62_20690 [Eisenbergiella tayi]ODR52438.1 hypothetical protein BEI59_10375 [Eisenbergiella tayi]ODR59295.1 hypothetical protein BEI63_07210 [Eisenbergiella tayi]